MKVKTFWKTITVFELVAIGATILFDLLIPTLVIIGLLIISLLARHEHIAVLGFKRPKSWTRLIGYSFLAASILQFFHVSVTMPVMNRLTGTTIDYSGFSNLMGNVSQLLFFLLLSWTLAALGEEIVYRGYIQKLLIDLLGGSSRGIILMIGISSLLFGLAHIEQGLTGVVVATIDAVFFSLLKQKFDNNLWAPVLAHGFYNSLGMLVFFLFGPIYGLW